MEIITITKENNVKITTPQPDKVVVYRMEDLLAQKTALEAQLAVINNRIDQANIQSQQLGIKLT